MSKIKVSAMTGKLKEVSAINSSPLDNPFCIAMAKDPSNICSKCYSQKMLKGLRKNCRPSWTETGRRLSSAPITPEEIPTIKTELCRFSAHGDLINSIHSDNLFRIAEANPEKKFGFWTKRPELVNTLACPSNVVLVYSSYKINERGELPKGFHKVFTVYNQSGIDSESVDINCGAKNCNTCRLCYDKTNGVVFVNEKIK